MVEAYLDTKFIESLAAALEAAKVLFSFYLADFSSLYFAAIGATGRRGTQSSGSKGWKEKVNLRKKSIRSKRTNKKK